MVITDAVEANFREIPATAPEATLASLSTGICLENGVLGTDFAAISDQIC